MLSVLFNRTSFGINLDRFEIGELQEVHSTNIDLWISRNVEGALTTSRPQPFIHSFTHSSIPHFFMPHSNLPLLHFFSFSPTNLLSKTTREDTYIEKESLQPFLFKDWSSYPQHVWFLPSNPSSWCYIIIIVLESIITSWLIDHDMERIEGLWNLTVALSTTISYMTSMWNPVGFIEE